MNTVTHALLPVLAAKAIAGKKVTGRELVLVGLLGAAPDLINPHLTLTARMNSWSHGLPAWGGITLLLVAAALLSRGRVRWRVAGIGSLAYLLHLFCDAIAGGINWLSPVGEAFWGDYWFPVILWTPADAVLALTAYFVFRAIPKWKEARRAKVPAAS